MAGSTSSPEPLTRQEPDATSDKTPEPSSEPAVKPIRVGPVRRLLSLAIAGFAALLTVGLIFGAHAAGLGLLRSSYAVVILGIQALFVLTFTIALRPPAPRVVAAVGLLAAVAADAAAVVPAEAAIAPLGYIAAGGFLAAVIGQLSRRSGRIRVTESLSASLLVVVGVIAYATLIVLTRLPSGTQAILVSLTAAGVALVVARTTDTVLPWPRLAPQVPRGAAGVVVGAMLGTAIAGYLGRIVAGFTPGSAALLGLVTAMAAVLADLSVGYAEAGRREISEAPTLWIARHMQGPLAGFGLAAPLAYLVTAIFLAPTYV